MKTAFFDDLDRLDSLIAAGPERCNYAADLQPYFTNPQAQRYFFKELQSPDWLELLLRAGLFDEVPHAIVEGNSIGYPSWPAGDYLKRMAPLSPALVSEIVLTIPETSNLRVHDDLATAMISVPAKLASPWANREALWLAKQASIALSLPMTLGNLMQHLATGEEVGTALTLAAPLLAILDVGSEDTRDMKANLTWRLREPRTRAGLWEYEQILGKNMPSLVEKAGLDAVSLLCDLLDQAILASDHRGSEMRPNDYSRIWRPAIEDHVQNMNMGVKPLLLTGVRNAAEQIARSNPESLPALVDMLDGRGDSWTVFRRIALHLLRIFSEPSAPLVRAHLLDRANFDEIELQHEYFLLTEKCFGGLSTPDQEVILGWIKTGPVITPNELENWERNISRAVTEEDKNRYARQWRRVHLAPIEKQLAGPWRVLYDDILRDEGEAFHPEFSIYRQGGTRGPSSPVGAEALAGKTAFDLVSYLNSWQPAAEVIGRATPEGLGRLVSGVIANDPVKYAADAQAFTQLNEPTYVRSIIQGFHDALRQGQKFDWAPIVGLCASAVTRVQVKGHQDRGPGFFNSLDRDPDWSWAKAAVARLLVDGFTSKTNPIPFNYREQVWVGIEAGTTEADPSAEAEGNEFSPTDLEVDDDEADNRRTPVDLLTRAINSTRGVAMGAVVDYALWVRNTLESTEHPEGLRKSGFRSMPEVQAVLELHLDKRLEKSLTIRAIYGQRVPWLQLLDQDWARKNTARIFDRTEPNFWHAAWDTYIGYASPYDNVFEWLYGEYAHAVEQIGKHRHFWADREAPDFSLAQHLMTFYWRGTLNRNGTLLTGEFFRRASGSLRKHALNFIGRSLRNTETAVPSEILERMKKLWEDRVDAVTTSREAGTEELQEFGSWFVSGKFEDDWSIQQLLTALALSHRVELDFMVVDRLAEFAAARPLECVKALRMIAESDDKGWTISGWSDKARDILSIARRSKNRDARREADALINYLGSLGYFDFRDLLKEPIN